MRDLIYFTITAILTVVNITSYMPQIIKLVKTKSSSDLSLLSWI